MDEIKEKLQKISQELTVVCGKSLVVHGRELTNELSKISFDLDRIIELMEV